MNLLGDISMTSKVVLCGIDTTKLPKLSAKEQLLMLKEIQNGQTQLKTKFIYANLKLVLSVIHRFIPRYPNAEDLFQVGCVGLIKAIDNFDLSLNLRFSTYAVPMIVGEIRRFLRDNNCVRVTRSMRDLAYQALKVRDALESELNREPNVEEIAEKLEVPTKDVTIALEAIAEPMSLYDPIYSDDNDAISLMEQVSDESEAHSKFSTSVSIKEAMKTLPAKEREILIMRYFLGKTQIEISKDVGISQAQVSRLEKNALKSVRKAL